MAGLGSSLHDQILTAQSRGSDHIMLPLCPNQLGCITSLPLAVCDLIHGHLGTWSGDLCFSTILSTIIHCDNYSCSVFCLSRRLWQHVTASLKAGNIDAATEHKHCLEERQRSEGKRRAANKTPWKPRYFVKEVMLAG